MTLAAALDLVTSPAGDTTWNVPDTWQQGRGTFGGLTLSLLAKAAARGLDVVDRPLRTITAEIPGALAVGPARVEVIPLREGHALTTRAAHLEQGGQIMAHAVFNFGRTRDVDFDRVPAASPFPPFGDVRESPVAVDGPVFARHFEYRIVQGVPLSGDDRAVAEGWLRVREPGDVAPWLAQLAMVDVWFPSALPIFRAPRPFGTISFAAHLFDRGWKTNEPLFHRSRLLGSQRGYFAELRELFTADGELCAVNQQTMAIIR